MPVPVPQPFQWTKPPRDVKQSFRWQLALLVPVLSQKLVLLCPTELSWEERECLSSVGQ